MTPTPSTPPSPTDLGPTTCDGRPTAPPLPHLQGIGTSNHRTANLHWGDAPRILGIPLPAPSTGAFQTRPSSSDCLHIVHDGYRVESVRVIAPKIEFPKFDGENLKLWQQQCETYFEVFRVQPCLRTQYGVLGFQGNVALWFQGVEAQGRVENWEGMCRLVHDYFGKNKQASYRHQLRVLRQTGTVSDY